jgi:hypothetical protein
MKPPFQRDKQYTFIWKPKSSFFLQKSFNPQEPWPPLEWRKNKGKTKGSNSYGLDSCSSQGLFGLRGKIPILAFFL